MYELLHINNNANTVVHYPSNNQNDPHLNKIDLAEELSSVGSLTYNIYPNNPGYANITELRTRAKVLDVRDNSIKFIGRVLSISEKMESSGEIYKQVVCEDALSYLNDTKQRGSTYTDQTATGFITQILNDHNSKVDDTRKIYPGNIDISGTVTHTNEYKSTLAELLAVVNEIGGYIRVRETNGLLYLDWLNSFANNTLSIELGINMKEMVREKDVTSFGSRIIPLGANNLTIESVNGGLDYIDDASAVNTYGVIEKTVEYTDIEDATELRNKCLADLSDYTQPTYTLEVGALDLSFLTNNKANQFYLGVKLHIVNSYMGVDAEYSITKVKTDLLKPYDSTLTISNKSTLSSTINDIRSETIQNDGVYNNVQIGRTYGIRAVRNDQKVITTINATDGISIENNKEKIFYVDLNGNLVAVNIEAKGGTFRNITVRTGNFTNIVVEDGLTIEDGDTSCEINSEGIMLTGPNGKEANIQILDDGQYSGTYIRDDLYVEDVLRVFGEGKFESKVMCYDDLEVEGDVYVNGGDLLEDYINDLIKKYSKDKGWE